MPTPQSSAASHPQIPSDTEHVIRSLLQTLYPAQADHCWERLSKVVQARISRLPHREDPLWTERDITLITYGDQISDGDTATLATFEAFLRQHGLHELLSIVHILPFCPYSSDDGFSVIDFRQVDQKLGDWSHLDQLAQHVDLMFDLVLNHCSQHSEWFQRFIDGDPDHANFFITVDPSEDVSQVTRPRSHPLLTPFETPRGTQHVWTTFSDDQVDLNFAEPAVLVEMIDILLQYVEHGARIIRLDAIAYLWKRLGTTCIHLTETHAVVKLMRALLDHVAPHVILLTETNVPHTENISYFGDGDEARMVYNFSLPPLLLDAYLHRDATTLQEWLGGLQPPGQGTTWFNFTSSHDGIGVRPLEGLVGNDHLQHIVDSVRSNGGKVNMRRTPAGDDIPYELNITWLDALRRPNSDDPLHIQRFLGSQAFMLALQGVPAVYFHCLVGTPNDIDGMQRTGHNRTINRRKYDAKELTALLSDDPAQSRIFAEYQNLLRCRIGLTAFHPDAPQNVIPQTDPAVVLFQRGTSGDDAVVVAANFSDDSKPIAFDPDILGGDVRDAISGRDGSCENFVLQPAETVWLTSAVK